MTNSFTNYVTLVVKQNLMYFKYFSSDLDLSHRTLYLSQSTLSLDLPYSPLKSLIAKFLSISKYYSYNMN